MKWVPGLVVVVHLLITAVAQAETSMALPPGTGGDYKPGTVFRDCPDCPEMVVIPAGSFIMGSDASEAAWANDTDAEGVVRIAREEKEKAKKPVLDEQHHRLVLGHDTSEGGWERGYDAENEYPQHRVTIKRPFAVSKYVVTEEDWQSVVAGNPGKFKGSRKPAREVSWNEAQEVIRRLNAKVRSRISGSTAVDGPYRLLTEAEWEYAARSGTTTRYYWGNTRCMSAEHCDECAIKQEDMKPNPFGLYNMSGFIWQWVEDCYVSNYFNAPNDGRAVDGPKSCRRVQRGGSCTNDVKQNRSAVRTKRNPDDKEDEVGFRLARTLP